jgi:hypothetical protein
MRFRLIQVSLYLSSSSCYYYYYYYYPGLGSREHCRRDPLCWPCDTLCPQKLVLTSQTSSCCSVGIVFSRTKATEFILFYCYYYYHRFSIIRLCCDFYVRKLFTLELWCCWENGTRQVSSTFFSCGNTGKAYINSRTGKFPLVIWFLPTASHNSSLL